MSALESLKSVFTTIKRELRDEQKIWKIDAKLEQYRQRFPQTPALVTATVINRIEKYRLQPDEERKIGTQMRPIAERIREIVIDQLWEGDSSSGCYEYSLMLRDAYNFVFQEIGSRNRAFLLAGHFGPSPSEEVNHHWVVVINLDKIQVAILSDVGMGNLSEGLIVDGTVDQFGRSADFPIDMQTRISHTKVYIGTPPLEFGKNYHPISLFPAEQRYFKSELLT